MVISPEHLALQWVSEVSKFRLGLKVVLLDVDSAHIINKTLDVNRVLEADIFIITLASFVSLAYLSDNYLPSFFRIVIDECHDVGG